MRILADYRLLVDWPKECAAVIPCLNEAGTIATLISDLKQFVGTIIVVDDGSSDATAQVAAAQGALIFRHEVSRGKGAALASGLAVAHERGFSWALILDGDGQHLPADVPAFFEAAEQKRAELIIGNRMDDPRSMPLVRRFVNRWMSKRLSHLCGRNLPDSQCGFRLLQLPVWLSLDLKTTHFEIESEMLWAFAQAACRIEFVPIQVVYKGESSKIHPLKDTWRWMLWWWSIGRRPTKASHHALSGKIEPSAEVG